MKLRNFFKKFKRWLLITPLLLNMSFPSFSRGENNHTTSDLEEKINYTWLGDEWYFEGSKIDGWKCINDIFKFIKEKNIKKKTYKVDFYDPNAVGFDFGKVKKTKKIDVYYYLNKGDYKSNIYLFIFPEDFDAIYLWYLKNRSIDNPQHAYKFKLIKDILPNCELFLFNEKPIIAQGYKSPEKIVSLPYRSPFQDLYVNITNVSGILIHPQEVKINNINERTFLPLSNIFKFPLHYCEKEVIHHVINISKDINFGYYVYPASIKKLVPLEKAPLRKLELKIGEKIFLETLKKMFSGIPIEKFWDKFKEYCKEKSEKEAKQFAKNFNENYNATLLPNYFVEGLRNPLQLARLIKINVNNPETEKPFSLWYRIDTEYGVLPEGTGCFKGNTIKDSITFILPEKASFKYPDFSTPEHAYISMVIGLIRSDLSLAKYSDTFLEIKKAYKKAKELSKKNIKITISLEKLLLNYVGKKFVETIKGKNLSKEQLEKKIASYVPLNLEKNILRDFYIIKSKDGKGIFIFTKQKGRNKNLIEITDLCVEGLITYKNASINSLIEKGFIIQTIPYRILLSAVRFPNKIGDYVNICGKETSHSVSFFLIPYSYFLEEYIFPLPLLKFPSLVKFFEKISLVEDTRFLTFYFNIYLPELLK